MDSEGSECSETRTNCPITVAVDTKLLVKVIRIYVDVFMAFGQEVIHLNE